MGLGQRVGEGLRGTGKVVMGEGQHLLLAACQERDAGWNSWGCPVQREELVPMVLVGPFHLRVFFAFMREGQTLLVPTSSPR